MTRTASLLIPSILLWGCGDAEVPTGWDPVADDPADEAFATASDPVGTIDSPASAETTVIISDEFSESTPPPAKDSFSLPDTDSIYFYAYFPDLESGNHVAVMEIDGPDGYTYRTLSAPFTVGTGLITGGALSEMGTRVVLELPVAGSSISRYGLTGQWGARLLLDIVAGPALFEAEFEIYQPVAN